uniref:Uncharacterized protein n=1 Tax=Romanomermis culicivorax TaxID=13658 RepID=A0A915L9S1_ROMCU
MLQTWSLEPQKRPNFTQLRQNLRRMLEELTEDYLYLKLDCSRDYYNVHQDYPSGQGFSTTASATDGPLIVESPSRKKTSNNNFRTPMILTPRVKSPNRNKLDRLQGFLNSGLNLNDETPSALDVRSTDLGVTNRNYEQYCQTTANQKLSPAPIGRLKTRINESSSSPLSKNTFEISDDETNGTAISRVFVEESDDSEKPFKEENDQNSDDNSKMVVSSATDYSEQNSPVSNCPTTPRLSSTSEQMLIKKH